MLTKPLVIFDGDCAFCRWWIVYLQQITKTAVDYAPFQTAGNTYPKISREQFETAVQLVLPTKEIISGAGGILYVLSLMPRRGLGWRLYKTVALFKVLADWCYRLAARHRHLFYHLTTFFFGKTPQPKKYMLATWFFLKALGIIYLIAFASLALQAHGLIGSNGILPFGGFLSAVHERLGSRGYWLAPTIFWLSQADWFLNLVLLLGVVGSSLLIAGVATRPMLVALFVLYLSIVTAGQDFMSFQWDVLLLETGFLAIFLGSGNLIVWVFRLLLFKLVFLSGAVKLLSGDVSWRNLTTLTFHYETQPLPTPLGWWAHQLPAWFQKFSVLFMFAIELMVPFFLFTRSPWSVGAVVAIVGLQALILLTGNYTFFNWLTIALTLFVFDDSLLQKMLPTWLSNHIFQTFQLPWPGWTQLMALCFVVALGLTTLIQMIGVFKPLPRFFRTYLSALTPFHINSTYGLFASMTNPRYEIIIEGSRDGQTWLPYKFNYKPGEPGVAPRWVAPHQPRLDWQMWFAALGRPENFPWFQNLLLRLLQGSPPVLGLLAVNHFPDHPPHYLRASFYEYHFTTVPERQATRAWWKRELKGLYYPLVSLPSN